VAYILLALLRIPRPETLKEYAPTDLGRIVGLDRLPEVKTLRRKLARLASRKASQEFGRELARRRIAERGRMMGFLYIDGHVRAYHGKHTIPKAYLTRTRLAVPGTTDYWVNDTLIETCPVRSLGMAGDCESHAKVRTRKTGLRCRSKHKYVILFDCAEFGVYNGNVAQLQHSPPP
jgi:hypothetical protein